MDLPGFGPLDTGPLNARGLLSPLSRRVCVTPHLTTVAGNGGGILVGGVAVASVLTWSAQPAPRNADITSSSSGGFIASQTVIKGWKGTVKIQYDSDRFPAAAGIGQGLNVTLALVIGASGRSWGGTARLDGASLSVDNQNGVVTYECAWESNGTNWSDP